MEPKVITPIRYEDRRGFCWLDTRTHESLIDGSNFVRTIETRQGLLIGSPEEIALNQCWISNMEIVELAKQFSSNDYGKYRSKLGKT